VTTPLSPADQRMVAAFNNFIDLGFILMSDILELTETDYESRSPSWRRNYIRTSIALIEGYGHCLREMCAVGVWHARRQVLVRRSAKCCTMKAVSIQVSGSS
jgi:hypothetical protein